MNYINMVPVTCTDQNMPRPVYVLPKFCKLPDAFNPGLFESELSKVPSKRELMNFGPRPGAT